MLGSRVLRRKDIGFFSPSGGRRMLILLIVVSTSTGERMVAGNGYLRMKRGWFGNYILWGCEPKLVRRRGGVVVGGVGDPKLQGLRGRSGQGADQMSAYRDGLCEQGKQQRVRDCKGEANH